MKMKCTKRLTEQIKRQDKAVRHFKRAGVTCNTSFRSGQMEPHVFLPGHRYPVGINSPDQSLPDTGPHQCGSSTLNIFKQALPAPALSLPPTSHLAQACSRGGNAAVRKQRRVQVNEFVSWPEKEQIFMHRAMKQ